MTITTFGSDLGKALYHAVWQLVRDTFFDTNRLSHWDAYEHQFASQIIDEPSALRCIDEMLSSLGDPYTERIVARASAPAVGQSATSADAVPAQETAEKQQPEPVMAVLRPDGMGYIRILSFDRADIFELVKAGVQKISGCDGVVLDLRQNSGGRMHEALASCGFFLKDGLLATLELRNEDGLTKMQYALSPTEFFANETRPDGTSHSEMYERPEPMFAGKPIVLLINRRTASSGEMMTAALVQNGEEGKVCLVGSGETPGKGIGQNDYTFLEGHVRIRITRTRWFTPGGEWLGNCGQTERNGIAPEVVVENDRGVEGVQAAFRELRRMLDADKS